LNWEERERERERVKDDLAGERAEEERVLKIAITGEATTSWAFE